MAAYSETTLNRRVTDKDFELCSKYGVACRFGADGKTSVLVGPTNALKQVMKELNPPKPPVSGEGNEGSGDPPAA